MEVREMLTFFDFSFTGLEAQEGPVALQQGRL